MKGSQVEAKAQIFLRYVREDEEKIGKLHQKLSGAGFKCGPVIELYWAGLEERKRTSFRGALARSSSKEGYN